MPRGLTDRVPMLPTLRWVSLLSVVGIRLQGMKAGRRFRVELTDDQARLAEQTGDACRAV